MWSVSARWEAHHDEDRGTFKQVVGMLLNSTVTLPKGTPPSIHSKRRGAKPITAGRVASVLHEAVRVAILPGGPNWMSLSAPESCSCTALWASVAGRG